MEPDIKNVLMLTCNRNRKYPIDTYLYKNGIKITTVDYKNFNFTCIAQSKAYNKTWLNLDDSEEYVVNINNLIDTLESLTTQLNH